MTITAPPPVVVTMSPRAAWHAAYDLKATYIFQVECYQAAQAAGLPTEYQGEVITALAEAICAISAGMRAA
jgi:hypothetical protein